MQLVFEWLLASPVRLVVVALVLALLWGLVPRAGSGAVQKDTQRMFDGDQRARIHSRAGGRCEHKSLLWFRCKAKGTQADHIYPHSRGGATSLANGQSLCGFHNRRKSASIPSRFYLWRLERRRRKYFPPGERVDVYWRQPSQVR